MFDASVVGVVDDDRDMADVVLKALEETECGGMFEEMRMFDASAGEGVARTRVTRWGQNLSMVSRKCTTSMTSAGIRDVARARAPRDRFERSCER